MQSSCIFHTLSTTLCLTCERDPEDELKSQGVKDEEEQRLLSNLRVNALSVEQPPTFVAWRSRRKGLLVGGSIVLIIAAVVLLVGYLQGGTLTTRDLVKQSAALDGVPTDVPDPPTTTPDSSDIDDTQGKGMEEYESGRCRNVLSNVLSKNKMNRMFHHHDLLVCVFVCVHMCVADDYQDLDTDKEPAPQQPLPPEERKEDQTESDLENDEDYDYEPEPPTPKRDGPSKGTKKSKSESAPSSPKEKAPRAKKETATTDLGDYEEIIEGGSSQEEDEKKGK